MINLTIKRILEFYDVPQLFVAQDTLGINYLCVLYSEEENFEYLGIQMSDIRLNNFLLGQLDLRKIYLSPEQENSLYHITVKEKAITADRLLNTSEITEQMLPEPGFYYSSDDAVGDSNTDSIQLDIPVKDRGFFADMAARMGWIAKSMDKASRRIAVL